MYVQFIYFENIIKKINLYCFYIFFLSFYFVFSVRLFEYSSLLCGLTVLSCSRNIEFLWIIYIGIFTFERWFLFFLFLVIFLWVCLFSLVGFIWKLNWVLIIIALWFVREMCLTSFGFILFYFIYLFVKGFCSWNVFTSILVLGSWNESGYSMFYLFLFFIIL